MSALQMIGGKNLSAVIRTRMMVSLVFLMIAASSAMAEGVNDLRGVGVCNISKDAWPLATSLGARWWRTPPIIWGNVEPRRGQITFERLDKIMLQTQEVHLIPVVPLVCSSNWGAPPPPGYISKSAEPTAERESSGFPRSRFPVDINAWQRFVREVVERYDDDGENDMPGLTMPVRFWQPVREIPSEWDDTPFRLVDFLQITSSAIKEADPRAVVIAPGIESRSLAMLAYADGELRPEDRPLGYDAPREGVRKMAEFEDTRRCVEVLLESGKDFYQALDVHLYGQDVLIAGKMRWLKNLMRRSSCDKPIISLEAGGPIGGAEGGYTDAVNAEQTVKILCSALHAGVVGIAFPLSPNFPGARPEYQMLSLLDARENAKPAYFSLKMLIRFIQNWESVNPVVTKKENLGFVFASPQSAVYVLWSDEARSLRLPLPSGNFHVYSIITQPGQTEPERSVFSTTVARKFKLTATPVVLVELARA